MMKKEFTCCHSGQTPASSGGRSGIRDRSVLDSGACPGPDPGSAKKDKPFSSILGGHAGGHEKFRRKNESLDLFRASEPNISAISLCSLVNV